MNRFVRRTRAVIIPVEAMKDIIKTICYFSASNWYAQCKLILPANRVVLSPIEPYRHREPIVISKLNNASIPQGIRAAAIPSTARIM